MIVFLRWLGERLGTVLKDLDCFKYIVYLAIWNTLKHYLRIWSIEMHPFVLEIMSAFFVRQARIYTN